MVKHDVVEHGIAFVTPLRLTVRLLNIPTVIPLGVGAGAYFLGRSDGAERSTVPNPRSGAKPTPLTKRLKRQRKRGRAPTRPYRSKIEAGKHCNFGILRLTPDRTDPHKEGRPPVAVVITDRFG